MERNTLMAKCYPKIKDYCREKHGLEFQVSPDLQYRLPCRFFFVFARRPSVEINGLGQGRELGTSWYGTINPVERNRWGVLLGKFCFSDLRSWT